MELITITEYDSGGSLTGVPVVLQSMIIKELTAHNPFFSEINTTIGGGQTDPQEIAKVKGIDYTLETGNGYGYQLIETVDALWALRKISTKYQLKIESQGQTIMEVVVFRNWDTEGSINFTMAKEDGPGIPYAGQWMQGTIKFRTITL